jgi:hypothetical protein
MIWLLFVTLMAALMPIQEAKGCNVEDVLPLLKRHEIQVLLAAGLRARGVRKAVGTSAAVDVDEELVGSPSRGS